MSISLEKVQMQNLYYTERADSAISNDPFFRFGKVVWGADFVTLNGDDVVFADIPKNVSEIKGEFFRRDRILNRVGNRILLSATMPEGEVDKGETKRFTALYLLDGKGQIITVFATAPVWATHTRSLDVNATFDIGDL